MVRGRSEAMRSGNLVWRGVVNTSPEVTDEDRWGMEPDMKLALWANIQDLTRRLAWDEARDGAMAMPCDSCKSLALQFIEIHELASAKINGCRVGES